MGPCSMIQGSILSAFLYTIFVNEVTILHKLMGTELFGRITKENPLITDNIGHNIIHGSNPQELEEYINSYFKLIEGFYAINSLKLNPDKTRLMVVCKPNRREEIKNLVLRAGEFIIGQKDKIKVLGVFFSSGLTNHVNVSNIIAKVNFRMFSMREAFKFSNKKTKIIFFKSMVLSVI